MHRALIGEWPDLCGNARAIEGMALACLSICENARHVSGPTIHISQGIWGLNADAPIVRFDETDRVSGDRNTCSSGSLPASTSSS